MQDTAEAPSGPPQKAAPGFTDKKGQEHAGANHLVSKIRRFIEIKLAKHKEAAVVRPAMVTKTFRALKWAGPTATVRPSTVDLK
jgi:hypothetical protein